MGKKKLDWIW